MRFLAFTAGVLAAIVGSSAFATRASAQNYPWCAQYGDDFGGSENCGFVSFDQCMLTVRGMGGFCVENNTYEPTRPATPVRRQAHRHHAADNS